MSNPSDKKPEPTGNRPDTNDPFKNPILKALRIRELVVTSPLKLTEIESELRDGIVALGMAILPERKEELREAVAACLKTVDPSITLITDFQTSMPPSRKSGGEKTNIIECFIDFKLVHSKYFPDGAPPDEPLIKPLTEAIIKMHQSSLDMEAEEKKQRG